MALKRDYSEAYTGEFLNKVAFPLGGIGAGMVCLEGSGALSHISVRNRPDVFKEPLAFSALCIKGDRNVARILEGPVPEWKIFGPAKTGNGGHGASYGLPRLAGTEFSSRFPFATIKFRDKSIPLDVRLSGWSPFVPGDADSSSLPVAALEYTFKNRSDKRVEAVYSFHAENFMATENPSREVKTTQNGFVLRQYGCEKKPHDLGSFSAAINDPDLKIDHTWFRGSWFDALSLVWKTVAEGRMKESEPVGREHPSPGGSLYLPFALEPGEKRTITLHLAWYVPITDLRIGKDPDTKKGEHGRAVDTYIPWYSGQFKHIRDLTESWQGRISDLRAKSEAFSDCFYDTTLPPEVIEAIAANLTILKSPTVLRQHDGRLWAWEGCCDGDGCCSGSCTHVWNYAQALPHLFPDLERTLRETEFNECQDFSGHQMFRAPLPIREPVHDFHAAADGQLGGIMKVYRDWRVSGNTKWLQSLWPQVKQSLEYCIETWDPDREGALIEPHHNTYDIEFWGPDGMCSSFYLGALKAAVLMARALGDNVAPYEELFEKGRRFLENELYNGSYFIQRVQWDNVRAESPVEKARKEGSPELLRQVEKEGPRYQYGSGCLSDGIMGAWMAEVCGFDGIFHKEKVRSHLLSVHKHNFRKDLSEHANPQRPTYALGKEAGLLLCSWPEGKEPSLPFVYSNEVWTGIEYQVASHLMMHGQEQEGLEIVKACRDRYDGRVRNPFNEYECGHWYARAMSSYALIQGMTGVRYDAVDRILYFERPEVTKDFRAFIATATGYGTVGLKQGKPFLEVKSGTIDIKEIQYGLDD